MDNLFSMARISEPNRSIMPLSYHRAVAHNLVEWAIVRGSAVALPLHFHDEDQITFVLQGRRRFQIGDSLVEVVPGEGTYIRAGTPHLSFDEPQGVYCLNIYIRAGGESLWPLVGEMTHRWRDAGRLSLMELAAMASSQGQRLSRPSPERPRLGAALHEGNVKSAAVDVGMSREGFSRAFRRAYGVAPSVFKSLTKLNEARLLLRAGVPLAAVAAEAGFSDQSHLGRCFRRAFGVTPGRYRAGAAGSHPFQTAP